MMSRKLLNSSNGALVQRTIDVSPRGISFRPEDDFSFVEVWRVLRKRKWIIAGTVLASTVLALMLSLMMTPKYEAVSTIEVNKENSDMLGLDDMAGMAGGSD